MPADAALQAVSTHYHSHGVPAHQALDAPLHLRRAGKGRLLFNADRVDVRRVGLVRQGDTVTLGVNPELTQKALHLLRSARLHHVVQGIEPLPQLDGVQFSAVLCGQLLSYVAHFHPPFPVPLSVTLGGRGTPWRIPPNWRSAKEGRASQSHRHIKELERSPETSSLLLYAIFRLLLSPPVI